MVDLRGTGSFNGIVYRNIRGDLKARFCKVELSLEQIEGRVDVENDFGNTEWLINKKACPKPRPPHRYAERRDRNPP